MKSSFNSNAAQSNSRRFWKTTSNFGKPEYRVSREAYEAAHLEAERIDTTSDARRFADELPPEVTNFTALQESEDGGAFWIGFFVGGISGLISGVAFACWLVKA
jgi:hypothetical protein